jgi:TetR/AcrR family transcriptional regulator, cholesterol catabolism regulator
MKARAKNLPAAALVPNRTSRRASAAPDAPEDLRDAVARLKRERIVAAAVELFYHQGYARTTLDQVADKINVTKPFIYQYFKSKSALLAEICGRAIRLSHEALNRALVQQGTPTARLKAVACDFMLTVLTHQSNAVIYSREEKELEPVDREAINVLRREFDRRLVALIEEGVATGEFQVEDVHLTALSIGGIVGWSQVWYRSAGRLTREEASEGVSKLVLAMVRAKPPRRSGP